MKKTIIYTNKTIVAQILCKDNPNNTYYLDPQDERSICDFLSDFQYPESNGIPAFIEASSWCASAPIGSRYESDQFEIEIVDLEEDNEE